MASSTSSRISLSSRNSPSDCDASGGQQTDRLSQLPDRILALILSFLTVKQAAQTSVISRRWMSLWRYIPKLNLEDSEALQRILSNHAYNEKGIANERTCFIRWVNRVLEKHHSEVVDEVRIIFDLVDGCSSDVDKWVDFITVKNVTRLDLNFLPFMVFNRRDPKTNTFFWPPMYHYPRDFGSALTSLCLKYVNVTTEVIERLLDSSQKLEKLHIDRSELLTSVRASSLSLPLRDLKVSNCPQMQGIDISAPNLLSLTYFGDPILLNIRNASSLSMVSVGGNRGAKIGYAFEPLSIYFSQLEHLHFHMCLCDGFNLKVDHQLPTLSNLKHLKLTISAILNVSILGWIPLIQACPVLEKLTLKLEGFWDHWSEFLKHEGRPLECLKVLEIIGYDGCRLDNEFATYVMENSIVLETVILEVHSVIDKTPTEDAMQRARKLKEKLPKGAKLIIK